MLKVFLECSQDVLMISYWHFGGSGGPFGSLESSGYCGSDGLGGSILAFWVW